MHHISLSSSGGLQAATIEESSLTAPTKHISRSGRVQDPQSSPKAAFRKIAKETRLVWYRGFFGCVNVQFKSTSLSGSNTCRLGRKAANTEKTFLISSSLLRKAFELRFLNSFGQISRTLSTYPVLERTAPIFDMCFDGDVQGLQVALSSGDVSPFVLDQWGQSLLHVSPLRINGIDGRCVHWFVARRTWPPGTDLCSTAQPWCGSQPCGYIWVVSSESLTKK